MKLFCQYTNQEQGPNAPWAIATGWLIKDDLLVTAGHCAYDWNYGLGPLKQVKVYVGYCGKENVTNPIVDFRYGAEVATTIGWLSKKGNRASDVCFIRLSNGFKGVIPFKFTETPAQGKMSLGVVGYPGDMSNSVTGERGAFMYEDFQDTSFDLTTSEFHMLHYSISTYGGKYN